MTLQSLILPRGLRYPGGAFRPGVNRYHPASRNLRFAGMAIPSPRAATFSGAFIDLTTGIPSSAPGGNLGGSTDSLMGPVAIFAGSFFTFAGKSQINDSSYTFGGIAIPGANNGEAFGSAGSVGGNGAAWAIQTGPNVQTIYAGSLVVSTTTFTAGRRYFMAVSANATQTNFVQMDLQTGQLKYDTQGGLTNTAPDGNFRVGADGYTNTSTGTTATIMAAGTFLTLRQLIQWARDPWSFWYPGSNDAVGFDVEIASVAAGAPPAGSPTRTLMGVGK